MFVPPPHRTSLSKRPAALIEDEYDDKDGHENEDDNDEDEDDNDDNNNNDNSNHKYNPKDHHKDDKNVVQLAAHLKRLSELVCSQLRFPC